MNLPSATAAIKPILIISKLKRTKTAKLKASLSKVIMKLTRGSFYSHFNSYLLLLSFENFKKLNDYLLSFFPHFSSNMILYENVPTNEEPVRSLWP